ncbi:MAG: hypothetical protein E6G86_16405 [Alphaproteobacteria bacterium]|nr:MAG: hypothetical protein E6G86_16405 [Alphaproteobacteria bacterium]
MSEPKSRLITICMLVGAVTMIGLALTGVLQVKAPTTFRLWSLKINVAPPCNNRAITGKE